jgi:hypothetical protein
VIRLTSARGLMVNGFCEMLVKVRQTERAGWRLRDCILVVEGSSPGGSSCQSLTIGGRAGERLDRRVAAGLASRTVRLLRARELMSRRLLVDEQLGGR